MDFEKLHLMSKKEKIDYLENLINCELEKDTDDMDVSLIDECTLYILSLKGLSPYEPKETDTTENLFEKAVDSESSEQPKKSISNSPVRKWRRLRKTILVACIMTLLLVASTFAITATEDGYLFQLIKNAITDNFENKSTCHVFFVRDGVEREYMGMNQFVYMENYDTLSWPKSEKIKASKITAQATLDRFNLSYITSDCNTLFFTISNTNAYKIGIETGYKEEMLESQIKAYYKSYGENYLIVCKNKGWYYAIATRDYNEGIEIMNSIF